ncbi:hypothetical protein RD792_017404 [Penstemon davidsonii]|uniref:Acireductone dioxygenase n=1 Tax=Penstemon davidsonii TaxID=160366 RepID=A0ABR0CLW7_9LAMI|nr:hypothetical protein RD792_017404 [Penstemon davidsonii]
MAFFQFSSGSNTAIGRELPEDVMIQILVCLPVKSILRFRCVSKSWHAMLKSHNFINSHLISQKRRDVLLVRRCLLPPQNDDVLSFHDPNSPELEEVSPNLSIPFLKDIKCRYNQPYEIAAVVLLGLSNGLVCIFHEEFIILCNPALREFKRLPPCPFVCPQGCYFFIIGHGFGNTSNNDFKVVLLQNVDPDTYWKPHLVVNVYDSTTKSWKQIDAGDTMQLAFGGCMAYFEVFFNGVCHWYAKRNGLNFNHAILCFDISTEVLGWLEYPDISSIEHGWRSLFVINGCLAVAWYDRFKEDPVEIWVMKEYGVKYSWTKQFVIGPFVDYFYPFLAWKNEWLLMDKADEYKIDQLDERAEVIQAWYMDDSDEDQRLPHHKNPKEFVSFEKLDELGVLSWKLDADNYETDPELKKIRESRGYSYMDFCEVCPEKLPNYEEKIKNFFEEHLHTDEEIRYCVAGSGYFDVRDRNEAWIRVWVKKGAMIVLPAGIYHRFTLDSNNYIKAMRLFVGDPIWTPFNRPHDNLPARKQYVETFVQKEEGVGQAVDAAA